MHLTLVYTGVLHCKYVHDEHAEIDIKGTQNNFVMNSGHHIFKIAYHTNLSTFYI